MAFGLNTIVRRKGSGSIIPAEVTEDVARGDVVTYSSTDGKIKKVAAETDIPIGVVHDENFYVDLTQNAHAQSEARIWAGPSVVYAKVAAAAQTAGTKLMAGTAGNFIAFDGDATKTAAAIVVDGTAVDTDYCLVRLLF